MPEEPSQAPTAEGTLARTPFSHLLVYIADRRLSGSLRLLSPQDQDACLEHLVVFDGGAPAKVRTGEPIAYLGRVLFELALVSQEELDRSLVEVAQTRELHGQYLLRTNAIDPAGLENGLRAQAVRKLGYLFQLPASTQFSFYSDLNLLSDWGGAELFPLDPLPLIWNAVRARPEDDRVDAMLARLGSVVLRLHPQSDVSRFGFTASESAAIDLIRASPQPLDSLVRCGVARDRSVRLMVYTLLVTRHLDHGPNAVPVGYMPPPSSSAPTRAATPTVGVNVARMELKTQYVIRSKPPAAPMPAPAQSEAPIASASSVAADALPVVSAQSRSVPVVSAQSSAVPVVSAQSSAVPVVSAQSPSVPVVSAESPPVPSPTRLSPDREARRNAILERAAGIDREDYFTMLGLTRQADARAIETVYLNIAKLWHPDRLPSELAELKPEVSKVFSRMIEAYQTLSDDEARVRYLEVLKGGSGTPEESERIQKIVGATTDFQRAEVFLRKHDLESARKHIERAREADPDQAEYAALYAQVLLAQRSDPTDLLSDVFDLLRQAIEAEPRCERAYLARAYAHKRLGKLADAIADFRRVVELNPKSLDAVREVRLYEMRHRGPKSAEPRTGVPHHSGAGRGTPKPTTTPGNAPLLGGVLSGLQKLFKG